MSIENPIPKLALQRSMWGDTTYHSSWSGNVGSYGGYRHIAPLEQRRTFWVLRWGPFAKNCLLTYGTTMFTIKLT